MGIQEQVKHNQEFENTTEDKHHLILHNDDVHTFDFVITSLIDICKHDVYQAEQCAYIVHHKGKCDVKKGSYDFLHPMKDQLTDKGLSVTID
ncbi:MAG: ATP-dependent Clp protease adaptor ClpS [Bacteroidales bacterium]|jgi:ATP-dependent Clp protease adaptor protein ClpS|nr:ATP-dependent Clp protease adaptor ClpS [Bacteroidales bacterium]